MVAPTPSDKSSASRARFGLMHVLTGDGRGKTTSALGLALRAYGTGARVAFIQFIKKASRTGEELAVKQLGERFIFEAIGAGFIGGKPRPCDLEAARVALQEAERLARSGCVDMLILDEAVLALKLRLIARADIEKLIELCRDRIELVLTGRGAPRWLKPKADYYTHMREVKHPFSRGVRARRGVEF